MPEIIAVPMDAERVCEAIARIGYTPAAALMDVVDNSVSAGAKRVVVEIEQNLDKTYSENDNVNRYRIFDDGEGMSDDGVLNAFKLGTPRDYPEDSLSKFGMGLKSADLSLGGRITVLSRKQGAVSQLYYLDKEIIAREHGYVVCREVPSEDYLASLSAFLGEAQSGTLVEVSKCAQRNHASAKRTVDRLQDELGTGTSASYLVP